MLCLQAPETAAQLCKDCPFAVAAWNHIKSLSGEATTTTLTLPNPGGVSDWWDGMLSVESKESRPRHTIWNLWKERNRRIFNGTRLSHLEVAPLAFEDIKATGNGVCQVTAR